MSNTKSPDAEMTIQGDEQTPSASAQLKRRLQEILQCVVCLQVSPDKIIQCQNGHLLCKRCSKNDNIKQCPTCRGPLLDKKVRNLAVEQFIEFMGMTFECQHPNCEFSAPKNEMVLHDKKCAHRVVTCPNGSRCCRNSLMPVRSLLSHLEGSDRVPSRITFNPTAEPYIRQSFLYTENWMSTDCDWDCKIIDYQDQVFLQKNLVKEKTFYTFMYIFGDEEEAKKFSVTIFVKKGYRSIKIGGGRIYPIDERCMDVIKKQNGVLQVNIEGELGAEVNGSVSLFEDTRCDGQWRKKLDVFISISAIGQ